MPSEQKEEVVSFIRDLLSRTRSEAFLMAFEELHKEFMSSKDVKVLDAIERVQKRMLKLGLPEERLPDTNH
jgi:hypothetical protein